MGIEGELVWGSECLAVVVVVVVVLVPDNL